MQDKKYSSRMNGKGYYIALILCAVAIGITGYLYYRNAGVVDPNDLPAIATGGTDISTEGTVPDDGGTQTNPTVPNPPKPQKLTKTASPLQGQTVLEYAMDCLTYNPTTRDWRTHNGIDIAAGEGTTVSAAADGTVHSVYDDDTMGKTVVISHEDGYTTSYACLSEEILVEPGDKVTLGQAIGTVGETALLEAAIGYHVHFGVTRDGEAVDPADFFNIGK